MARYAPVVLQAQDYYAFGIIMPQRSYTAPGGGYRYGFNGKENDNEVKGVAGSQQDYGMRIYDPRVGRFLSVDPKSYKYHGFSPYCFAAKNTIIINDENGKGPISFRLKQFLSSDSWYATGFVYGFGDGLIETGDLASGLAVVAGVHLPFVPPGIPNPLYNSTAAKKVRAETVQTVSDLRRLVTDASLRASLSKH
ncbi:MAG: hypothetical protein MUF62_08780 [Chitinophagaceae bacterium]|nr:hypothetical protein [Chitinophagaceae bacterium]